MIRRTLLVVVALLLVGACGGIPTSGPVSRVQDDGGLGESTVQYAPALPKAGATPQQIVLGFVDAMLAFPVSTGTASAFLTPAAAKSWRPLEGVRVYSRPEVSAAVPDRSVDAPTDEAGNRVVVRLTADQVAKLDQQGRYTRLTGDSELSYVLQLVEGEWRIATPQDGMLVSSKYFSDHFRPFDIYMFDRPGRRLLPVPVHLAVGDQLATSLVSSLALGPPKDLGDLTRTYVPAQDALRPSVPVSVAGVADVEFDTELRTATEAVQDRLSAQIIWTLRQVPGIRGARLTGGATVVSRNGLPVQPIGSWGAFGPSPAGTHAYAIAGDKVVQIDDGDVVPLSGEWGKDAGGAERVAISDSGVAAVLKGRSEVRVTNRAGNAARTFTGDQLLTPRWDRDGVLWLVDRLGGDTRVRLVRDKTFVIPAIGALADLDVNTFTLSPGGSRYAVTTDSGVYVGLIERNEKNQIVRLAAPTRVATDYAKPSSAVWATDTRLVFLAGSDVSRQTQLVSIDGSVPEVGTSSALLPDVGADVLVLGAGDPADRYVTDAKQRLWYLPAGGTWRLVKSQKITGLTYGS